MTLLTLLLVLPAPRAGAFVEIGGGGGFTPGRDAPFSAGIDLGAGIPLRPRWDLGAVLASGEGAGGPAWARTGVQVRSLAPAADGRSLRPYLLAGVGAEVADPTRPALWIGPGVLSGGEGAVGWRLEGRIVARLEDLAWEGIGTRIEVGLGLHLRTRAPPPASPPIVSVSPPDARIWLPHPWCAWVAADALPSLLASIPAGQEIVVTAEGRLPAVVPVVPGEPLVVELVEAPHQGALVVLASPGDRVRIGNLALPTGADGALLVNLPEGPIDLDVTGGGRTALHDLAVAEGWATWLRVLPPESQSILFAHDSSDLDAAARAQVTVLAAQRGGWRYRLAGSWSTEGAELRNTSLGRRRAEAVRDALLAAGVPEDAVELGLPIPPPEGPPLPRQRVCQVQPLPPEAP